MAVRAGLTLAAAMDALGLQLRIGISTGRVVIRNGQPFRTPFPPGQEVERYPRTGWDRPKASDHCPIAITLHLP